MSNAQFIPKIRANGLQDAVVTSSPRAPYVTKEPEATGLLIRNPVSKWTNVNRDQAHQENLQMPVGAQKEIVRSTVGNGLGDRDIQRRKQLKQFNLQTSLEANFVDPQWPFSKPDNLNVTNTQQVNDNGQYAHYTHGYSAPIDINAQENEQVQSNAVRRTASGHSIAASSIHSQDQNTVPLNEVANINDGQLENNVNESNITNTSLPSYQNCVPKKSILKHSDSRVTIVNPPNKYSPEFTNNPKYNYKPLYPANERPIHSDMSKTNTGPELLESSNIEPIKEDNKVSESSVKSA